jgi:hypothetical protein
MIELLLIILITNISFWFYLFDIINIYNLFIIPIMTTKIILTFEKDVYYICSNKFSNKFSKKLMEYDDNMNKKCLLYIFGLFIKKTKIGNNIQSNIQSNIHSNIHSKIIINDDSENE